MKQSLILAAIGGGAAITQGVVRGDWTGAPSTEVSRALDPAILARDSLDNSALSWARIWSDGQRDKVDFFTVLSAAAALQSVRWGIDQAPPDRVLAMPADRNGWPLTEDRVGAFRRSAGRRPVRVRVGHQQERHQLAGDHPSVARGDAMNGRHPPFTPAQQFAYALAGQFNLSFGLLEDRLAYDAPEQKSRIMASLARDWSATGHADICRLLLRLGTDGHRISHRLMVRHYSLACRPEPAARREEMLDRARDTADALEDLWRMDAVQADRHRVRARRCWVSTPPARPCWRPPR